MTAKHKQIPMASLKSSSVSAAGYDPVTKTLSVQFANGGVYHYAGVAQSTYDGLLGAKSVGKFLKSNVIGKHAHKKL